MSLCCMTSVVSWISPLLCYISAVKCNDSVTVLEVLAALGTGFDCASKVRHKSLTCNPKLQRFFNLELRSMNRNARWCRAHYKCSVCKWDKFFLIWFCKWRGKLCLGGSVAGSNESVGIVMCSVGSYRLNQTGVAKEITKCDDVEDRNNSSSDKTDCLEMNRKRDVYGDIWCWFLEDFRTQEHSQPFLNKDIPLCSALGVYLIWKVAVLCPSQVFVPLLVTIV